MNWVDPWGLMQKAAFERDHCGSGGGACVAFGILALVDYLGDGIKKAGESIADGVKQGAHWAGKKISEGVSAAKVFFSKGKKVRDKELQDMKKNHPTHPDYKPPKNWNGRKVRVGDKAVLINLIQLYISLLCLGLENL